MKGTTETTYHQDSLKPVSIGTSVTMSGYLRKDSFGRLYIDACPTDSEHITKKPEPGQERLRCRRYIEDLFSESFDGRKIQLQLDINMKVLEGNHE